MPKLFVISAPSGCGKTTLAGKLLAEGMGLVPSVSVTTRPPRPGEKKGVDYIFVSRDKFLEMIKNGEFLECEENFGHLYGTPKRYVKELLAKKRNVLLSIDVKGAMKVKKAYPKKSVLIFLLPPSIAALKRRLECRRSECSDAMSLRLETAKKELEYKDRYDYRIVNDKLESAYRKLKNTVAMELKNGG